MDVIGYTENGMIRVEIDGGEMFVPDDVANRHRQIIAQWEAVGNTIPSCPARIPTQDDYRAAIQSLIDSHAQSRRYDSGNSLATYVSSSNPAWAAEAQAFVNWRDAVWAYAYAEMDKVMAGEREQPSVEDFIGELPQIVWPV